MLADQRRSRHAASREWAQRGATADDAPRIGLPLRAARRAASRAGARAIIDGVDARARRRACAP
ncbi:MAG: hypothetical protein M0C28_32530 [Candidatus Moduliflexus flocculans]|nr:hypothetical protein [Candidatus Moduliflexus flocculans]